MTLREMTQADLDAVVEIERQVHAYPWTRGNFADALAGGSLCRVYEEAGEILGYLVLMPAVDDMELLDVAIGAAHQRKGLGRSLLQEAMEIARGMGMRRLLLEVRPSNVAALALYREQGFDEIGLRRGYYAAGDAREDAIVMQKELV